MDFVNKKALIENETLVSNGFDSKVIKKALSKETPESMKTKAIICAILLDAGADINQKNKFGMSAFDISKLLFRDKKITIMMS